MDPYMVSGPLRTLEYTGTAPENWKYTQYPVYCYNTFDK